VENQTTEKFLSRLRELNVELSLIHEKLNCTAPKGVLTNDLKSELIRRKPEIIELLRNCGSGKHPSIGELVPIFRTGDLPLSHAQERLWFLNQYSTATSTYCIPFALRLKGPLDRPCLKSALKFVIRRHESLRTGFRNVHGRPVGFISEADSWSLEFEGLSNASAAELDRVMRQFAQVPIDVSCPPLVRAKLFEIQPEDHVLFINVHQIAADGWSIGILARELNVSYAAFLQQKEPDLPPLLVQFVDYVAWHAETFGPGSGPGKPDHQLDWWKRQLKGPLPVLELPSDLTRPPFLTHNGRREDYVIDAELVNRLHRFSHESGTTLFMTLLTAFKIVLYRYTGVKDLLVGSAVAGRVHPDVERIIGLFINTLVLRTGLEGDPPVTELLHRVRETTLSAFAHSEVPFDQLVTTIQPERDLNHSALVQVMFTLQNFQFSPSLGDLDVSLQPFDPGTARFDLSVEGFEKDGALVLQFEYNTDLLEPATIRRLQSHLRRVMEGMIADPEQRISQISLLSEDEQSEVLANAAPDQHPYPQECVHDLILQQARRTPDRIAVSCETASLTYAQLMEESAALARHLRSLGVGPGVLVAIGLERSVRMPVALLGVLQAGGAYVPLDPQYPRARLKYMLEDSRATVLVTETALLQTIPSDQTAVVCLDAYEPHETDSEPLPKVVHSDAAYVIYTSGSTGNPKGVQVGHSALSNFLHSMKEEPGISQDDRLLAVTTLCFDIAGLEMYLPLMCGARIEIAPRAATMDPALLAAALRDADITIMQATPATWRMLLDSGWEGKANLKTLCGGEAMPSDLAGRLLNAGCDLWNLYGPTETTIWSTVFHVEAAFPGPIPIGKPIANTSLFVLDERQQLSPVGVAGELYIGGDGLAHGYLRRPELTSEKFVDSPFVPGRRLYRTGDLVRRRNDGLVQYLGRLDHQVKVRGFRIELGEIEAAIASLPGVRQAVVVADGMDGNTRLIAYLESSGTQLQVEDLRAELSRKLPEYMVPSGFICLDRMPLTPNGKIDRKALPKTGWQPASATYLAPRNSTENEIAGLWRDLLKVERVGANENFFDLGGHSLLVVRLQSRLRERFGCEVPLILLFQNPTVASMAECLQQQLSSPALAAG
jgi:amino acid adenylation domain-containing protein